jgi:hypothetical protein
MQLSVPYGLLSLSGVLVDLNLLHLKSQRLLLPEICQLLRTLSISKLYITVCHIALCAIHEPLETCLVLRIVKMLVWVIWVQPSSTEIAEVRLALRACHMIATNY